MSSEQDRATELYWRYGPAIYARCRRLLGDGAAAEDATQETFLRVQSHLRSVPHDEEAKLWVFRVATNHCLDVLRSRARGRQFEAPPEPSSRGLEELLADRELVVRIVEAAPSTVRAAAFLHYVDDLDQGEVARILGVSRRTVGSRIADFLRIARMLLKQEAK